MALNVEEIRGGAVTATQIEAAYEPLNSKADQYEYQIIKFINGILEVAGIDDQPSFTRSKLINVNENVGTILEAAQVLDTDYVTEKILTILGDGDKADEIIERMSADELDMGGNTEDLLDEELEEESEDELLEEEVEETEEDTEDADLTEILDMLNKLLEEI
jgi:hypothetical protein